MATFVVQEVYIRDSEGGSSQRNVQYDIILSYNDVKLKVVKSLEDIRKFFSEVVSTNKFGPLSLLTTTFEHSTPPAEVIVRDLCDILLAISDNVWFHLDVINFFDGNPDGDKLTKLHMIHLTKQMQSMISNNAQLDRRVAALEEKMFEALKGNSNNSTVNGWNQGPIGLPLVTPSDSTSTKDYLASPKITTHSQSGGENTGRDSVSQSVGELLPSFKAPLALRSDASFHSSDESDGNSVSNDSDIEDTPELDPLAMTDSQLLRQPRTSSFDSKGAMSSSHRGNEEIAQNLLLFEETTGSFYEDIQSVLKLIMPTEAQFSTKASIFGLIRSQSRLAVNCSVFEFGLHEIGCNLPDDKVEISLLLSKNHFPTWHTSLCERLLAVAEGNVDSWPDNNDSSLSLGGSGGSPNNNTHKITDVRYTTDDSAYYVMCNVDTNWSIEISSNRRQELCMLAFYEEVANLVGKDYLFKRSLLLIRGWWSYETSTYVDRDIRHYLPESALCLMVCMIFNKFHWRIETPLQALVLFLAEFLQYDNKKHVITLQGLVPYNTHAHTNANALGGITGNSANGSGSSQRSPLQLIPPQPRHLLNFEILEKYWQLFNVGSSPAANNGMMNDSPVVTSKAQFNPYNTTGYIAFDKAGFNVLHPFTHTSLITEKVSSRRLTLIQKSFQMGATKLIESIQKCIDVHSSTSFIPTFFGKIYSKFGNNNRPQQLSHHVLYESNIFHYAIEKIWQNILHCNFVLESVITESAILTASMENLSVKGPSPVGEVGKMLTEVSCMPQLSLHLKEKFGGLKKFLERFPEIFVYSNDHPFNPHVLLRSMLMPEHQKMIYRGVIPMQVMTQYKKNASNKKSFSRQQNQHAGGSPHMMGPNGGATMGGGDAGFGLANNSSGPNGFSSQFDNNGNNNMPLSQFGNNGLIIEGPSMGSNNGSFNLGNGMGNNTIGNNTIGNNSMGNMGNTMGNNMGGNMGGNLGNNRFNKASSGMSGPVGMGMGGGGGNPSRGSQFAMNTPLPPTPNINNMFSSNNNSSSFGNGGGRDNFPSFNSLGGNGGIGMGMGNMGGGSGGGRFNANADLDNWTNDAGAGSSFGGGGGGSSRVLSFQQSSNNNNGGNNMMGMNHNMMNNNNNNNGFSNNSNYFSR